MISERDAPVGCFKTVLASDNLAENRFVRKIPLCVREVADEIITYIYTCFCPNIRNQSDVPHNLLPLKLLLTRKSKIGKEIYDYDPESTSRSQRSSSEEAVHSSDFNLSSYVSENFTKIIYKHHSFCAHKTLHCTRSNIPTGKGPKTDNHQYDTKCPTRKFSLKSSTLLLLTLFLIFTPTTEANWWFVSQIHSSSYSPEGKIHCNNIPGLVRRQRLLCERNPELMVALAEGASLGIRECQFQFQNSKWNCSIFPRDTSVFGKQVLRSASDGGSKESSFIYAINSAAVVHTVTRACSEGLLPNCACDLTKQGLHKDRRGEFTWGGCSDNLRFSTSFARRFIDAPEKRQRDVRAKAVLHNNRVGRKSVRKQTRLQCKCHGVSGSCSYRTCWLTTSPFRIVSHWLMKRYENAVLVRAKPDGSGLMPRSKRSLRKIDLVFLEKSPNYCLPNPQRGLLGTGGRQCNLTSDGPDGCSSLCCDRGFNTRRQLVKKKCECKFQWCCHVACKMCESWEPVSYCNQPTSIEKY